MTLIYSNIYIFLPLLLIVWTAINYFVLWHINKILPQNSVTKKIFNILILIFTFALFAGRLWGYYSIDNISEGFVWIGSFWVAILFYSILFVVLFDIAFLLLKVIKFENVFFKYKQHIFFSTLVTILSIVIAGYINAISPVLKKYEVTVNKYSPRVNSLKVIFVSDIHFSSIIKAKDLEYLINTIKEYSPDIVFFGGDILDEDCGPPIYRNSAECFKKIKAKYGVYGVLGNHEYLGNPDKAVKYLEAQNIKILRDTSLLIDSSFYLIGRNDKSIIEFSGHDRYYLKDLFVRDSVNCKLPLIVLDHQPSFLFESSINYIDVQFSGHTHNGQLFPMNILWANLFDIIHGYEKRLRTNMFVSSGYGTTGPRVRTTGSPEVIGVKINFKND